MHKRIVCNKSDLNETEKKRVFKSYSLILFLFKHITGSSGVISVLPNSLN